MILSVTASDREILLILSNLTYSLLDESIVRCVTLLSRLLVVYGFRKIRAVTPRRIDKVCGFCWRRLSRAVRPLSPGQAARTLTPTSVERETSLRCQFRQVSRTRAYRWRRPSPWGRRVPRVLRAVPTRQLGRSMHHRSSVDRK